MAGIFIRQLTHNNNQFESEWSSIHTKLHRFFETCDENEGSLNRLKIEIFDAIGDYILAEPNPREEQATAKRIFIEQAILLCSTNAVACLDETLRVFLHIIDQQNIDTEWYINAIHTIYCQYRLGELMSNSERYDAIEQIFKSLQKNAFLDEQMDERARDRWHTFFYQRMFSPHEIDSNRLNVESLVMKKRSAFQRLFRHAIQFSTKSKPLSAIIFCFIRTLPNLFDIYTDPNDVQIDMKLCVEEPISTDYIFYLSQSYKRNPSLIQLNLEEALVLLKKLILADRIREVRYFMDSAIMDFLGKSVDVEALVRMFTQVIPLTKPEHRNELCEEVVSKLTDELGRGKYPKVLAQEFFNLAVVILGLFVQHAPSCVEKLLEKNEFYPWKDLTARIPELIELCAAYEDVLKGSSVSELDCLSNIIRILSQRAKAFNTIFRVTHDHALNAIIRWTRMHTIDGTIRPWPNHVYRMANEMFNLIDQRACSNDICNKFIESLDTKFVEEDSIDMERSAYRMRDTFFIILSSRLADNIDHLKGLSSENNSKLAKIILTALSRPLWLESGDPTFEQGLVERLWPRICSQLNNNDTIREYELCVKQMRKIAYEEEEKKMFNWCSNFWYSVSFKAPDIAAEYVEEFFQDVFEKRQLVHATWLPGLYIKRPESFNSKLDKIIEELYNDDISLNCAMAQLFSSIGRERPDLFQAKHINHIFNVLKSRSSNSVDLSFLFQGLGYIASSQPLLIDSHRSELIEYVLNFQNVPGVQCIQQYFITLVILRGEQAANECLTTVIDLLKNASINNADIRSQLYRTCQLIGLVEKNALDAQRSELISLNNDSDCRMLIDYIDGNKLTEEYQTTVNKTREEIDMIQKRFTKTEQTVQEVLVAVQNQSTKIEMLDTHVIGINTRMSDLTEQIAAHAEEIERIDGKTLSYVPSIWGRDVCKLLNKRSDNDWRQLGKRFGYSTSELRHWSLQNDPTMAVLNEWFMTHKTDEATYSLLKVLDDIDRKDVTKIIRNALQAAGELIPDEMDVEIKRLPPVFLSYQWGCQQAVLRLKTHLEEAGFLCWMDIGQMGGGDKLFGKIDAGIRGAKVVICCMNKSYAQSDNCSREVHLAVTTGKQLIPLQMEKQTWPPEGALGPIMSEYLFIRFFDRKQSDPDYWPADKFTELLGQIRYHVAPDPDMISNRYQNWFVPRPENLIFLQPSSDSGNQVAENTPLVVTQPQIMISYQWDRQKDIIKLYEQLTNLGYRCWLDIFQMGGGDSLFEKIDQGIRNAKCVLACVTPKYILSINCRREMSLADALKKTILPLYLEETSTWPPPGPMSMVFTDKVYIDFRQTTNNIWKSNNFSKVLERLKDVIPEVNFEQPGRHIIDMKRPATAKTKLSSNENRSERVKSAPLNSTSRTCLLM